MTTLAGVFIALGLVTAAWITHIANPAAGAKLPPSSIAAWVLGLLGTVVLLLVAFGVVVVR